jgi:hypothetical protein
MIAVQRVESVGVESTAEHWAPLVAADWRASVAAIVATGRRLLEAKKACGRGEYGRLFSDHSQPCDGHLPFSSRTGQRLMAIAEHPVLSNPSHGSDLPASWRTLAELSLVKPKRLLAELRAGRVHPELERKQATELAARLAAKSTAKAAPKVSHPPEEIIRAAVKNAITKTVGELRTPEQFLRVRRMLERMLEFLSERQAEQVQGERERASAG